MAFTDERTAIIARLKQTSTDGIRALTELQTIIGSNVKSLQQISIKTESMLAEYAKPLTGHAEVKAAESSKSPYVLALIDAHSHRFSNNFFRANGHGGTQAARFLALAISRHISRYHPTANNYRLIIRLYADLRSLSQMASDLGLVGAGAYALAPFAASFSASDNFNDFVDVGGEREVREKICGLTKTALNDTECQHLILGSLRHDEILKILTTCDNVTDKVTLIQGGCQELSHFCHGIRTVTFPDIFQETNRDETKTLHITAHQTHSTESKALSLKIMKDMISIPSSDSEQTKRDKIGSMSKRGNPHSSNTSTSVEMMQKMVIEPPKEIGPNLELKLDITPRLTHQPKTPAAGLPKTKLPGFVPLNASGQRLDITLTIPPKIYIRKHMALEKKPCNKKFIYGDCRRKNCAFDHAPLSAMAVSVIKYLQKCYPCRDGSSCRKSDCYFGHICQRPQCSKGRAIACHMNEAMHKVNKNLAGWTPDDNTAKVVNYSTKNLEIEKKLEGWATFASKETVKPQRKSVWGDQDDPNSSEEEGLDGSGSESETWSTSTNINGHREEGGNMNVPGVEQKCGAWTTDEHIANFQTEGVLIDLSED